MKNEFINSFLNGSLSLPDHTALFLTLHGYHVDVNRMITAGVTGNKEQLYNLLTHTANKVEEITKGNRILKYSDIITPFIEHPNGDVSFKPVYILIFREDKNDPNLVEVPVLISIDMKPDTNNPGSYYLEFNTLMDSDSTYKEEFVINEKFLEKIFAELTAVEEEEC